MTQDVESDPQLNHLILGSAKDRLAVEVKKYYDFMDEFHSSVEQGVLDTLAIVFTADPVIQVFQWSQTAGEYNDSTYDGFSINTPSVLYNTPVTLTDWHGDKYENAEDEPVEIDDIPKGEVHDLLGALHGYILTTSKYWEDKYGSHIKISVDRYAGFSTTYDSY